MKNWHELRTSNLESILRWAATQDWAIEMSRCQQDKTWHAEGDVWTHTQWVCREVERLDAWPQFSIDERAKLICTALFHDSGKPATTFVDPETGRTRSTGHAAVGVEIARRVLRELGCDIVTREAICGLVAYHGRPPYLIEKERPEFEVQRLSWLVDNRLLYWFALADTRGREAQDMARPEENLHLWRLVCEEQSCFDRPFPFANDHARFLFYRNELSHPSYAPFEQHACTMTLMSGLPGVGKDTWLKTHRPDLPVVSLDEIRGELDVTETDNQGEVIQAAREQVREHLRSKRNFAFNATNISAQLRKRWINLAHDYGARIEIVYIEPPISVAIAQNRRRPDPVPDSVIRSLCDRLEPPTWAECHQLVIL